MEHVVSEGDVKEALNTALEQRNVPQLTNTAAVDQFCSNSKGVLCSGQAALGQSR
ncbi:MAG: hypothetical protein K2Q01_08525 [Rickettsiales bacterium]|nr:hypothetical protein [Rickettsiales bacterium]